MRFDALTAGLARRIPLADARALWAAVRVGVGLAAKTPRLLSRPEYNTKLAKTQQHGLCLLPHRLAGLGNVCRHSTVGCRHACLNTSGQGMARFVQPARQARTILLLEHPEAFATLIERELDRLPGDAPVRLNVFSDLPWETIAPWIFHDFPDRQYYDYTKYPVGTRATLPNYHLTYSAHEGWSDEDIAMAVTGGSNVAVVLRLPKSQPMPTEWRGLPVVDGDRSDARYDDPDGVVVALRAKGRARRNDSAFIRAA